MYVLQHTQKHNMLPEGTDLAALGLGLSKGRRISLSTPSSLASSRSDVSRDERGDRVHAAGPYMEGNMHLLATMWVLHFLTFSFIFIIIIIIVTFFLDSIMSSTWIRTWQTCLLLMVMKMRALSVVYHSWQEKWNWYKSCMLYASVEPHFHSIFCKSCSLLLDKCIFLSFVCFVILRIS